MIVGRHGVCPLVDEELEHGDGGITFHVARSFIMHGDEMQRIVAVLIDSSGVAAPRQQKLREDDVAVF